MPKAKQSSKKHSKKSSGKGSKPDYIDLDKDGNKTESMKKAAKDKKQNKGKKNVVKESALISNFIKCVAEENYAEANKYLKQVIESKLQAKIAQAISTTLF